MYAIKGSNASETKLIKAIQRTVGSKEDGLIGTATLCDLANSIGATCWPVTLKLYGQPVIVCKHIQVWNPRSSSGIYCNSLSGSFSYLRKPCSILVNNAKVICDSACHAWLGQPESVLYQTYDGTFGIKRVKSTHELPANIDWAIGGVGLLQNYNTKVEGFYGKYADVLRKTNHTAIGIKNNLIYLMYCKNMTADQVNSYCADKLKLDMAIMLDGGHVAAINGAESFAKINTKTTQWYMIQAI